MMTVVLLVCMPGNAGIYAYEEKAAVEQGAEEEGAVEQSAGVQGAVMSTEQEAEPGSLYALSACLMDGDTGRVLYEKDGYTPRANASTTKIMTCILAIEYGNMDDIVSVSKYAAGMPDVQLNIKEGENYRLGDLLYSLMLESHNDAAVAIAEHIGGDVKSFADMMNEKARELGCYDTYFITPNGLDATETVDGKEKFHSTTAADLARIMSYCIKNEEFLRVTRTSSYTFSNKVRNENGEITDGSRAFTVSNRNAFLTMMEGALSGKTGFTGKAGYCYTGALRKGERTFVVALLGCGWPNNKSYKWSDTKKLMNYGLEHYQIKDVFKYGMELGTVTVENGKTKQEDRKNITDNVKADLYIEEKPMRLMVADGETAEVKIRVDRRLNAPVFEKQVAGSVEYYLNGDIIKEYPVYVSESVEEADCGWYIAETVKKFFIIE